MYIHFPLETYAPVILTRRARALRQRDASFNGYAAAELDQKTVKETVTIVLIRPIRLFSEPIILYVCMFLALLFAIYYMFFEAYPLIFQGKWCLGKRRKVASNAGRLVRARSRRLLSLHSQ
jgi:hypothetical protein